MYSIKLISLEIVYIQRANRNKMVNSRLSVEQQQQFLYYFQSLLIDYSNLVSSQLPKFQPS